MGTCRWQEVANGSATAVHGRRGYCPRRVDRRDTRAGAFFFSLGRALALAGQFRDGWALAGRPRAGTATRGPTAAGIWHGMREDGRGRTAGRTSWMRWPRPGMALPPCISKSLRRGCCVAQGRAARGGGVDERDRRAVRGWAAGMWRPWYAALGRGGVLTGSRTDEPDPAGRAGHTDNPIAEAIVARAAAMAGPGPGWPRRPRPCRRRVTLSVGPPRHQDDCGHGRGRTGTGQANGPRWARPSGRPPRMRLKGLARAAHAVKPA